MIEKILNDNQIMAALVAIILGLAVLFSIDTEAEKGLREWRSERASVTSTTTP